jgi:hypothetical protein
VGIPRVAALADYIATSTRPHADYSVKQKSPSGASRGMGWGHSIPIGEGEIGPPRSGFVLRLCIRKADGA